MVSVLPITGGDTEVALVVGRESQNEVALLCRYPAGMSEEEIANDFAEYVRTNKSAYFTGPRGVGEYWQKASEEKMAVINTHLPKWKCHKEVWAVKIFGLEMNADGSANIAPVGDDLSEFTTGANWNERFTLREDMDFGYYVQYADGYESWSPSSAFENGYTLIE